MRKIGKLQKILRKKNLNLVQQSHSILHLSPYQLQKCDEIGSETDNIYGIVNADRFSNDL